MKKPYLKYDELKRKTVTCFLRIIESGVISAILISLLLITPFIVSKKLYMGDIIAKEFWYFGIIILMLLYWAINIMFKKGAIKIGFDFIDIILFSFYIWCFFSAIFTNHTPFWYNQKFRVLTGMMVVYIFVKWSIRNGKNNDGSNPILISFLILSFLFSGLLQAIYGLLQLYGLLPSLNQGFKITGSFTNPAPFAMYLSVIFPIALGTYFFIIPNTSFKRFLKYFSLGTLFAITSVLPVTYIRTAWVACIVGSFVVINVKFDLWKRVHSFLNTRITKVLAVAVLLVFSSVSIYYLFIIKADSAKGRVFIWKVTSLMIKEKPIMGIGYSRFEAEYNNWQADWFSSGKGSNQEEILAGNIKFAYNEFLELAAEIGIIGALLFFFLLLFPLFNLKRNLRAMSTSNISLHTKEGNNIKNAEQMLTSTSSDSVPINSRFGNSCNNSYFTISVMAGLISLFVCGLFSYPFYSLPTYILLFLFLSLLSLQNNLFFYQIYTYRVIKYLIGITLFIIVFLSSSCQHSNFEAYRTWRQAVIMYNRKDYKLATRLYENAYPRLQNNGLFLLHYGKCCEMNMNYEKSIVVLEHASNLYSDPIIYITLGNCYKNMKQFQTAENSYLLASNIEPNKIYPKYLLAMMYDETKQKEKAITMANKLLSFPIKVQSTAIKEIRKDMIYIIEKYK